jgi:hypothetical protein
LLWQLIYKASEFGFLPKQPFTAAFIENPFIYRPAVLVAIWVCRLKLDFQEIGVLCLVYCLWSFLWWVDQENQRRWAAATREFECIAPPS